MKMIKCPKCGREIHEEAKFCPYCMDKFTKVKKGFEPQDKRKYMFWIIVESIVIFVLATVILIDKLNDKNKNDGYIKITEAESESEATSEAENTGTERLRRLLRRSRPQFPAGKRQLQHRQLSRR